MQDSKKDLIIIGGGPAGYSAGIYAARYKLDCLVLTREKGGRIVDSSIVENYPGYKRLAGYELMEKMEEHLNDYDVEVRKEEVIQLEKTENDFQVKTPGKEYQARTVIIATGQEQRKLGVPGEERLKGKGVSYCATCEASFFKEKTVAMAGGGPAACEEALILSEYADKVYVIEMMPHLNAEPIIKEKIMENPKIEVRTSTTIKKIKGKDWVESVLLDSGDEVKLEGVFIQIGGIPRSQLAEGLGVRTNQKKEIVIDMHSRTSVNGLFAAGDVTNFPYKQAVVAAATGATAAWSAYFHVKKE